MSHSFYSSTVPDKQYHGPQYARIVNKDNKCKCSVCHSMKTKEEYDSSNFSLEAFLKKSEEEQNKEYFISFLKNRLYDDNLLKIIADYAIDDRLRIQEEFQSNLEWQIHVRLNRKFRNIEVLKIEENNDKTRHIWELFVLFWEDVLCKRFDYEKNEIMKRYFPGVSIPYGGYFVEFFNNVRTSTVRAMLIDYLPKKRKELEHYNFVRVSENKD